MVGNKYKRLILGFLTSVVLVNHIFIESGKRNDSENFKINLRNIITGQDYIDITYLDAFFRYLIRNPETLNDLHFQKIELQAVDLTSGNSLLAKFDRDNYTFAFNGTRNMVIHKFKNTYSLNDLDNSQITEFSNWGELVRSSNFTTLLNYNHFRLTQETTGKLNRLILDSIWFRNPLLAASELTLECVTERNVTVTNDYIGRNMSLFLKNGDEILYDLFLEFDFNEKPMLTTNDNLDEAIKLEDFLAIQESCK